MTQALSAIPPLQMQLTPMRLPEAIPTEGMVRGLETRDAPAGLHLLLHPGEPSEMMVQLQNLGSRSLRLRVRVEGNFPAEWCQIGGMESQELSPGQQLDAVLYFQLPANFFEHQQALQPGQALQLDYSCRLLVYYTALEGEGAGGRSGEAPLQATFRLHVRPHSLYTDFLPAIYQEADVVSRFLAIFEQAFEPAVQTLDAMWAHLDPLTAPQALLPFLGYWVAFPLDARWSVVRQRRLIRNALELYRWRGTRRGLRLYLHLYTDLPLDDHLPRESDKHISITELFSDGFVLSGSHIGQEAMLGGGRPYHFSVRLRQTHPGQVDEAFVRSIIEREKPAFCTYELAIESPHPPSIDR